MKAVRVSMGDGHYYAYREIHLAEQGDAHVEMVWERQPQGAPADQVTVDDIIKRWFAQGLVTTLERYEDASGDPPQGGAYPGRVM